MLGRPRHAAEAGRPAAMEQVGLGSEMPRCFVTLSRRSCLSLPQPSWPHELVGLED